jgi:pSer/pThr/pTyr-binding forkhead associated (FHA) protein
MKDIPPAERRAVTAPEPILGLQPRVPRARTVQDQLPTFPGAAEAKSGGGSAEGRADHAARPINSPADNTQPFRPVRRPPMALLHVLDDGEEVGEVIRIRKEAFTIGRLEGDLLIANDSGMSGRHAEISWRLAGDRHRWHLRDLNSMNGTFVRASAVVLRAGQEFLLGGLRLSFEPPATTPLSAGPSAAGTQKLTSLSSAEIQAASQGVLVEQLPEGPGRRFLLPAGESTVGRDAGRCSIIVDDPMVSPVHAKISHEAQAGRWTIRNAGSLNGLWLRVDEMVLDRNGQFQCGEQRFKFVTL